MSTSFPLHTRQHTPLTRVRDTALCVTHADGEKANSLFSENNVKSPLQAAEERPSSGWAVPSPVGLGGRGQQGIASMGDARSPPVRGEDRARASPQMQETVSALLGQLESQSVQPRKDNILPAIIAAAVLLASALYPLLRPVVSLFSGSESISYLAGSEQETTRSPQRCAPSTFEPVTRLAEDPFDRPPHAQWPGNAAMAFTVVVWLDDVSESGYGMRYGFWRLLAVIEKNKLRTTLVASPAVLLRCPEIVRAAQHHSWEIVMHVDEASAQAKSSAQLLSRCSALARAFQEAVADGPKAFYLSGPHSVHVRTEILNHLGLRYDARGEGDLPWRSPHLVVPSSPWFGASIGQVWEGGPDVQDEEVKGCGARGALMMACDPVRKVDGRRARISAEERVAVFGRMASALLAEGGVCQRCDGACSCASQAALMRSYAPSSLALDREREDEAAGVRPRDEGITAPSDCRPKMLVLDLWCGVDGLPGVCDVWDKALGEMSKMGARGRVWLATKVRPVAGF